jgi:hypothetical protein
MAKNLYEMEPDPDADITEWHEWAHRLKKRAITTENNQKELKSKIKALKRDIVDKEKSVKSYKTTNLDLENTIKNIKRNPCYKACKFIMSIKGRILSVLKKIKS